MTLLRDFGILLPDTVASCQQLMLLGAVYQGDNTGAIAYLMPEGEQVTSRDTDRSWEPSWAIWRSGPKRYFLTIEGTMGFWQTYGQGGPWALATYNDKLKAYTGSMWQSVANDIRDQAFPALSLDDPETKVYLSGHSLGGSIAQLLAYELVLRLGANRVQLMTFGQPRTVAAGWAGVQPISYQRWYSIGDFVPNYPADQNGWGITEILTPSSWVPFLQEWAHYGKADPITWDGKIKDKEGDIGKPGPGVAFGSDREHGLANYGGRLAARLVREGSEPEGAEALVELFTLLKQPTKPLVMGPNTNQMRVPDNVLGQLLLRVGPGGTNASSGGGSGVATVKHDWVFFDQQGRNWTESYYINAASAKASFAGLDIELINKRLAFLYPGCLLRAIRAREVGGARTSWGVIQNLPGILDIKAPALTPDVTSSAAVYDLKGKSGGQRKIWFRGLPDEWTVRSALNGQDRPAAGLTNSVMTWLSAASVFGYAILWRKKPDLADNTDPRDCLGVDGTGGRGATIVTVASAAGYVKGGRVRFSLFDEKIFPRLNGEWTLHNVVGTGLLIDYTVVGHLNYPLQGGRARLIVPNALATIDPAACTFDHFGSRQTKSDFTRSRGSRRAARLRLAD